jgi:hypothetical protein
MRHFLTALAAIAAFVGLTAQAAGIKDPELAARADDSYLTDIKFSKSVYRELTRLSDKKSGVQALALERKSDNLVIVAYAGTDPKDPKDLLSDLGLGAKEAEHVMTAAIFGLAESIEKAGWIPKGSAPVVRDALAGNYGGLKIGKAKAKYEGKFDLSCPKGSYFDPRNGGECWSCPAKNKRTVFPVNGGKACEIPLHEDFAKAGKKRKNSKVGQGCPKNQFWDVKGGNGLLGACYACPGGFHRTAFAVDNKKACAKTMAPKFSKASYRDKALCPKGAFFDPIQGGTCWSCPSGHVRSASSVKSGSACLSLSW